MLLLTLNVVYVLLAVTMIGLILMQRGAGAQAGSGFGAGASATVFGATGASNFLSKSTKWLAITFFAISLFMAWHATDRAAPAQEQAQAQADLGVLVELPVAPDADNATEPTPTVPSAPGAAAPTDATMPAAPDAAPAAETAPPAEGESSEGGPSEEG